MRNRLAFVFGILLFACCSPLSYANGFWDGISFHCDGQLLKAHYVATFTGLWAEGGKTAWLKVETYDPDPVLLLVSVYDYGRNRVVSYQCATTITSNCILNWTPKWNGDFYVTFENEGSGTVGYEWHYTNTVGWYSSPSIDCY